jgi:hypothetical protein
MQKYHLIDTGEVTPAAITTILYGRFTAPVLEDGKVLCDNHLFCLDTNCPPDPGEKLMIWCEHEYFCYKVSDYENAYRH